MGVSQVLSTCVADEWLVVWHDGAIVNHRPAGAVDDVDVSTVIHRLLAGEDAIDSVVTRPDGQPRRLRAVTIAGPADQLPYGVQVWVGGVDEPVPAPRAVAAAAWDTKEQHVMITRDLYGMSSIDTSNYGAARAPSTFTRKVFEAHHEATVLEACMSPAPPRQDLCSDLQVLHDDGHPMRWQAAMRILPDVRYTVRGLCHDITDCVSPSFDAAPPPRQDNGAVGIITYPAAGGGASLSHWVASGRRWPGGHRSGPVTRADSIHPDDQTALRTAALTVHSALPDASARTTIRIRDVHDQWMTVTIELTRYPTATLAGNRMHIAHMTPTHVSV